MPLIVVYRLCIVSGLTYTWVTYVARFVGSGEGFNRHVLSHPKEGCPCESVAVWTLQASDGHCNLGEQPSKWPLLPDFTRNGPYSTKMLFRVFPLLTAGVWVSVGDINQGVNLFEFCSL